MIKHLTAEQLKEVLVPNENGEFLCVCNNCMSLLLDENPLEKATKFDIKSLPEDVKALTMGKDEDGYSVCPICGTDEFLMDIEIEKIAIKKSTIKIKRIDNYIIFEHEAEDNSVKKTLEAYIKKERENNNNRIDLVQADLEGADLEGIDLSGAYLAEANLTEANLINANLEEANLESANLNNTKLSGATLINSKLSYADLYRANLAEADLSYAYLSNADLSYANLFGADLRETDLSFANLSFTNLGETKLTNTSFGGVNLNTVENLEYATCSFAGHGECGRQLLAIKIDDEIKLFCGCFEGNEAELREYIENHEEKYKASRLIALETVLKLIEIKRLD